MQIQTLNYHISNNKQDDTSLVYLNRIQVRKANTYTFTKYQHE